MPFTHDRFVDFLTTQSNVVDRVHGKPDLLRKIEGRLRRETEPFFRRGETQTPWRFVGWVAVFRRR